MGNSEQGVVGFDLDGVLCPDLHYQGVPADLFQSVLYARRFLIPLFQPKVPFHVITGRPFIDIAETKEWCKQLHNCKGVHIAGQSRPLHSVESAEFKMATAQKLSCISFVESDPVIASHMRNHPYAKHCPVYVFADWCSVLTMSDHSRTILS